MRSVRVLLEIAFRNLFANFLNVIVGVIILVGTFLVLVGGGLLDSMDRAMTQTITGSVAGHIQVYSNQSSDSLDLFVDFAGDPDIAPTPDFSKIRDALEAVPNVKTVIPMGIRGAMVTSGNTIDLTLERLRRSVTQSLEGNQSPELQEQIKSQKDHVRQIVQVLKSDVVVAQKVLAKGSLDDEIFPNIERASSEAFWDDFDKAPLDALEFLENQIAPLATDADILYIRYVGTDLPKFQRSFDRMKMSSGTMVPEGQRGFLFGKFVYEEFFKLKAARRLDKVHEGLKARGETLAKSAELTRLVRQNQAQTRELLLQLDRIKTQTAVERLQKALGSQETDLGKLLVHLFDMNDANFFQRYDIFYRDVAPLVDLYRVRVGDMLPIKTFTRSGYVESVNVKVYGVFEFKGLEESPLAGALSLMDLMTFRDLYGFSNPARAEEIKALKAASGVKEIGRETAEAELFGSSENLVADVKTQAIDEAAHLSAEGTRRDRSKAPFTQEEIDTGVMLNAAVILDDPRRLDEAMAEVKKVSKEKGLGLKVVTWKEAAGLVGVMIMVAKLVLYFAVLIIFIVALVIINNAMMMATLQRVREIGTMRAIGAQRSFVLSMVLTETVVLGLTFGALGTLLGGGMIAWLNKTGIPAPNEQLYVFFAGPRLYPTLTVGNFVAAFFIVLLVSAISTFYPAFIATRVSPIEAMQTEE